jgi:hypothetical protein
VSARRVANRILAGAGRPAKLYARATREMSVSVAPRDHRLLAELLVQSLEQDPNVRSVVNDAAFAAGQRAGDVFPRTVVEALRSCGYLPHRYDGGPIELRNRPFAHRREGPYGGGVRADLDPHPNRCCVAINPIT